VWKQLHDLIFKKINYIHPAFRENSVKNAVNAQTMGVFNLSL
jgi:hypothetical protein